MAGRTEYQHTYRQTLLRDNHMFEAPFFFFWIGSFRIIFKQIAKRFAICLIFSKNRNTLLNIDQPLCPGHTLSPYRLYNIHNKSAAKKKPSHFFTQLFALHNSRFSLNPIWALSLLYVGFGPIAGGTNFWTPLETTPKKKQTDDLLDFDVWYLNRWLSCFVLDSVKSCSLVFAFIASAGWVKWGRVTVKRD